MTIARQFNITEFTFRIRNKAGNRIYYEDSEGYWIKQEFDDKGNQIYWEDSDGFWVKYEYDSKGNVSYYENSGGIALDNR